MKKVFTVIMCILMLLLIAGCGSKNKVRKMPPENNYAGHTSEKIIKRMKRKIRTKAQ